MLEANNDIDFSKFTEANDIPIEEVIIQMEKELQMSGEQHTFMADLPESLIAELAALLTKIDRGTRVQNLFYRIDINPAKANSKMPHYEGLAAFAWNRVFQKVWFRRNFKTGNK